MNLRSEPIVHPFTPQKLGPSQNQILQASALTIYFLFFFKTTNVPPPPRPSPQQNAPIVTTRSNNPQGYESSPTSAPSPNAQSFIQYLLPSREPFPWKSESRNLKAWYHPPPFRLHTTSYIYRYFNHYKEIPPPPKKRTAHQRHCSYPISFPSLCILPPTDNLRSLSAPIRPKTCHFPPYPASLTLANRMADSYVRLINTSSIVTALFRSKRNKSMRDESKDGGIWGGGGEVVVWTRRGQNQQKRRGKDHGSSRAFEDGLSSLLWRAGGGPSSWNGWYPRESSKFSVLGICWGCVVVARRASTLRDVAISCWLGGLLVWEDRSFPSSPDLQHAPCSSHSHPSNFILCPLLRQTPCWK